MPHDEPVNQTESREARLERHLRDLIARIDGDGGHRQEEDASLERSAERAGSEVSLQRSRLEGDLYEAQKRLKTLLLRCDLHTCTTPRDPGLAAEYCLACSDPSSGEPPAAESVFAKLARYQEGNLTPDEFQNLCHNLQLVGTTPLDV